MKALNMRLDGFFERAKSWTSELATLREILSGCDVSEALKWGKPCYQHEGANIAIMQPMSEHLCFMFFKGALMSDPEGVLHKPGPNSRHGRRFQFTSASQITKQSDMVRAYVAEAIAIEKSGLKLVDQPELVLVDELEDRLRRDPELKAAFEALTPGRQRAYNLHFSSAKQSTTRVKRIDKYASKILAGKGLRDDTW